MRVKEQAYNLVVYLLGSGAVSKGSTLGQLRLDLFHAVKQVFGKNALTDIDLVTTVNKALSDTGVIL